MSPANLSLFPSPSSSLPRKSMSTSRTRGGNASDSRGDVNLRGLAFHVVSNPKVTRKIQPATDSIKHSLFCDPKPTETIASAPAPKPEPTPSSEPQENGDLKRQSRTRRKSSPISTVSLPEMEQAGEDELSPLPHITHFGQMTPPKRSISSASSQPSIPRTVSTVVEPDRTSIPITPVHEREDSISPLPSKTHFTPVKTISNLEYPSSVYSGSSGSSKDTSQTNYTAPSRSIFPTYDASKPLDQQSYYPTIRPTPGPPAYPGFSEATVVNSSPKPREFERFDSTVGLIDGYEHIPAAAHGDMEALWKASDNEYVANGRKVQFGLYQPANKSKSLAIGTSPADLIYLMEKELTPDLAPLKQYAIKKYCPTAPRSASVTTLNLPERRPAQAAPKESTPIFPRAAALEAIEVVLRSPAVQHIAASDPTGDSPAVAQLARNAVAEAQRRYQSQLIKRTRKRDTVGSVTAHYDLQHPTFGTCAVTVSKSTPSTGPPRARISLHHPSATPAAIMAETLALAYLDFANNACVIDLPGVVALGERYMADTIVSALLAVAVIEDDALLLAENDTVMKFEAPPRTPISSKRGKHPKTERKDSMRSSMSKSGKGRKMGRSGKAKEKEVPPPLSTGYQYEEVELGGVAKGVLAVIELGFKASAWVIVTGAKVGIGAVGYGVEKVQKRIGS